MPIISANFSIMPALTGGVLIGISAIMLMALAGRIAGITGLISPLLPNFNKGKIIFALLFIAGLMLAPWLLYAFTGKAPISPSVIKNPFLLSIAGFLVGFGAIFGHGCTSGHGVCGLARLSMRSFVAVCIFMLTAVITVYVLRHLIGGIS